MTTPRAINLRVDESLMTMLEAIVAQDRQKILDAGIEADANYSTVIRRLIKAEARRIGAVNDEPAPAKRGKR